VSFVALRQHRKTVELWSNLNKLSLLVEREKQREIATTKAATENSQQSTGTSTKTPSKPRTDGKVQALMMPLLAKANEFQRVSKVEPEDPDLPRQTTLWPSQIVELSRARQLDQNKLSAEQKKLLKKHDAIANANAKANQRSKKK
jgi:hypothetical protein